MAFGPYALFGSGAIAPILINRIWYITRPGDFNKLTGIRAWTKNKLQWHHNSTGFWLLFLLILACPDWTKNGCVSFFLGFGFGLVFDEICAMLMMRSDDRQGELKLYSASLGPTIILLLLVLIVVFLFSTIN